MRRLNVLASERHYLDHLQPVWDALPEATRGRLGGHQPGVTVLVASGSDSRVARLAGCPAIRMEHGVGQSYLEADGHESYPGAINQEHVRLFLAPNEPAADRWRERYPETPTFAVGCPKLDRWHRLPPKVRGDRPVVAVSFGWDCRVSSATRSPFWEFRDAVEALWRYRRDIELLGHWHPRATYLENWWRELGVPIATDFEEVLARADLYCSSNSSTLFEFASLDRPVVVLRGRGQPPLEAPYAGVGITTSPVLLDQAVTRALGDEYLEGRRRTTEQLYPNRGSATQVTVDLIMKELR